MIQLQTSRLNFRLWERLDFTAFADYFADEQNTTFLGGLKSKEAAWRLMATYIGHYHLNGFSYVAMEEKSTRQLIGSVGLWKSDPWPELELGYWILKKGQGKGYATEAAQAAKDFAFKQLNAPTLVSYIHPDNEASKRVAQHLGAFYEKDIELLDFGIHQVYRYKHA